MVVESHDPLTPVELDHHESVKVGIVLSPWQVVVSLNVSVSSLVHSREEITHFLRRVVMDVAEGLNVRKPLDVVGVVLEPNGSVEGHFVVLREVISTISSIALESLEKMLSKTPCKLYFFSANSS